jgi:hypothetical protein
VCVCVCVFRIHMYLLNPRLSLHSSIALSSNTAPISGPTVCAAGNATSAGAGGEGGKGGKGENIGEHVLDALESALLRATS